MSPLPLGILAASGAGGGIAEESIEYIASATVSTGTTAFLAFSNIPNTYKSLIVTGRSVQPSRNLPIIGLYFNGDTATNYSHFNINHYGYASISGETYTSRPSIHVVSQLGATASDDGVFESEILDYADPNKLTSVRSVSTSLSNDATYRKGIATINGIWNNAAPVTSIGIGYQSVNGYTATVGAGSTFNLYGIKG